MARFLEFIQNHPILVGILLSLIVAYFWLDGQQSGRKISPQALGPLISQQQPILVDLRDGKDFKAGHIVGSRHIPYAQLKDHVEELRASGKPVVFICKMGQSAGAAGRLLGTKDVYRLDGGILGWQSQGLPLVKSKTA